MKEKVMEFNSTVKELREAVLPLVFEELEKENEAKKEGESLKNNLKRIVCDVFHSSREARGETITNKF